MAFSSSNDINRLHFGARLRNWRKFRGWTQKQLAVFIGTNSTKVSQIEMGIIALPPELVVPLSALGFSELWQAAEEAPAPTAFNAPVISRANLTIHPFYLDWLFTNNVVLREVFGLTINSCKTKTYNKLDAAFFEYRSSEDDRIHWAIDPKAVKLPVEYSHLRWQEGVEELWKKIFADNGIELQVNRIHCPQGLYCYHTYPPVKEWVNAF